MPATTHAWSMVVGANLPCQSGIILGTSISRPSTLILIVSTGGVAGFVMAISSVMSDFPLVQVGDWEIIS